MITLDDRIRWIHKSSHRLERIKELPRSKATWSFFRREAWLHFRRSLELLWFTIMNGPEEKRSE